MSEKTKDLTGIFDLPKTSATDETSDHDPFAMGPTATEQVNEFQSIEEIGMLDPLPPVEETANLAETLAIDPTAEKTNFEEVPPPVDETEPTPTFMNDMRTYSEQRQGPGEELVVHYPFHLYLEGTFGPFERDKLLLFITENSVGVSSSDLDLQIKAGRVLFPRISEFAGIKLIQDLRDSGLGFKLAPSSRDDDEPYQTTPPVQYHYRPDNASTASASPAIPLFASNSPQLAQYQEIDTVQGSQFLKAEMVEAEKSELFQEIIERMTEALKQKARLKGGQALTHFQQKVTGLRLPSQYQLSVSATVLKKLP